MGSEWVAFNLYLVACAVYTKTFCDEQERWHASKMKDLFKPKQEFAKQRGKPRVVYSARSAFTKARGLNATSVQEPWANVKTECGEDLRRSRSDGLRGR